MFQTPRILCGRIPACWYPGNAARSSTYPKASRGMCMCKLESGQRMTCLMPCLPQKPNGHCIVWRAPTSYGLRLLPADGRTRFASSSRPQYVSYSSTRSGFRRAWETAERLVRLVCRMHTRFASSRLESSSSDTSMMTGSALTLAHWAWGGLCTLSATTVAKQGVATVRFPVWPRRGFDC
jgi:hypothetical protein